MIPIAWGLAINALGRFRKAFAAMSGESIFTLPTCAARAQPAILGKAPDGSTDQPLRQAKRLRQFNETSQRYRTAAGRNCIAQDGDKQRAAAQRLLAAETRKDGAHGTV